MFPLTFIYGRRQASKLIAGFLTLATKASKSTFTGSPLISSTSTAMLSTVPAAAFDRSYLKSQIDNLIKSEEDKRSYRAIELKNGLKILLVSDPTTDKSAASLDVGVGHLKDPRDLPGLAHFCEHMLFLGTKKYPDENEYQKFLSTHGGSSNAYTATDHTNYHFDVAPEHLDGALDRFAQFFLGPLFTSGATEREVNAVDSEHKNNVQSDMWRLAQLERSFSNPSHDYSKFGTGNRTTLLDDAKARGVDPREELLKFHNRYYSANLMGLCVVGKQSLDELASMVVPLMGEVENKNVEQPMWIDHPYGPEQLGYRLNVVPVKDLRSLHVFFPIPDLHPYYRSNPGHYVGHLLGHEGPGSLLSELKNRGWVNSLSAGPRGGARGFAFFMLDFDLSEEGLEHVNEIIELMFAYISLLTTSGPQEWIHRECEDLNKMHFRFKDKERPSGYATSLSHALHYYPMEEVLYGPYIMSDYRPELIDLVLKKLIPKNMGYAVISKKFQGQTDKKEQWYGTDYQMQKFELDRFEKSKTKGNEFKIPDKNDFIPTNFKLYEREKRTGPVQNEGAIIPHTLPELLKSDQLARIWYKQDDEFLLPKCCVLLQFRSPVVYSDPLNASLAYMYVDLLRDSLTEYTYNAELAGLKYGLENGKYGIGLSVSGYNEKQAVLLKKLVEKMKDFEPDPKRFEILRERYVRNLKNFAMEQPYQHAVYYTSLVMSERCWTKEELLREAESLDVEMLKSFVPRFLSSLFIEALVHGNTNKQVASELIDVVRNTLQENNKLEPLFSTQLTRDREISLPHGSYYVFEAENSTHSNSSVEVFIQTGVEDTRHNMLVELLAQIAQEPCFDQLRTKEQLGYIVFSGVRRAHGTQGVRFIVQSEKPPAYVESRIEIFLTQMHHDLLKMPADEFQKHKKALAAKRLEKPKKLASQASKYWSEINAECYNFDRDNIEVQDLEKITMDELVKFYEEHVALTSPKRKKLSVYVYSSDAKDTRGKTVDGFQQSIAELQKAAGDGIALKEAKKIDDISSFKSSHPLYPLPRPFIAVPPGGAKVPKSML